MRITIIMTMHHHHDHAHDEACGCGHAHVPTAAQVKGEWSWRQACSMAFAIGIRPCSGALIVLFFAYPLGLYWAGVASTLVMALGTAITVSVIAAIAVYSKHFAMRWAKKDDAWMATARLLAALVRRHRHCRIGRPARSGPRLGPSTR